MSVDTDRSKRYTWTGDDDMEIVEEGTGKAINIEDLIAASNKAAWKRSDIRAKHVKV